MVTETVACCYQCDRCGDSKTLVFKTLDEAPDVPPGFSRVKVRGEGVGHEYDLCEACTALVRNALKRGPR